MSWSRPCIVVCLALGACVLAACPNPQPPPTRQLVVLTGSPYERGLQHGTQLRSQIREFYTTLLTTSLLPYLNREQPGIEAFLPEYQGADYANGQFSYQLLLDSALKMEHDIPLEYQQEMQGIAAGSGLTYEQVLVLNTFAETTLAVRAVALALQLSSAPQLQSVQFIGLQHDDIDNDGDGTTDQPGEGLLSPYLASAVASEIEVPPNVSFQFVLSDPDGVDATTLRLALGTQVFLDGDPALAVESLADNDTQIQVTLTPPAPLPMATAMSVSILAGSKKQITDPPPAHPSLMREERITFTTLGAKLKIADVSNRGIDDGRSHPTSMSFAATGAETADGSPLLAQHFALLDANTSHNNTAIFIHHPDDGSQTFAVVGWAGIVWGFSGLNAAGQAYACQPSDTLDNAVLKNLIGEVADLSTAKLVMSGTPIGFVGREILQHSQSNADAVAQLEASHFAYGWNCLFADAAGEIHAAELDANTEGNFSGGIYDYGSAPDVPANIDASGKPWASLGPNDLFLTSHFLKNSADIPAATIQGERVLPQSQWSSFYFRSLRTRAGLGDALQAALGHLDAPSAESILATPGLIDTSDSMNAVVIAPATRTLYSAMGTEPATDSPFETLDLRQEAQ